LPKSSRDPEVKLYLLRPENVGPHIYDGFTDTACIAGLEWKQLLSTLKGQRMLRRYPIWHNSYPIYRMATSNWFTNSPMICQVPGIVSTRALVTSSLALFRQDIDGNFPSDSTMSAATCLFEEMPGLLPSSLKANMGGWRRGLEAGTQS